MLANRYKYSQKKLTRKFVKFQCFPRIKATNVNSKTNSKRNPLAVHRFLFSARATFAKRLVAIASPPTKTVHWSSSRTLYRENCVVLATPRETIELITRFQSGSIEKPVDRQSEKCVRVSTFVQTAIFSDDNRSTMVLSSLIYDLRPLFSSRARRLVKSIPASIGQEKDKVAASIVSYFHGGHVRMRRTRECKQFE